MKPVSKINIDTVLGEIFKEYRLKNNLTQERIAEKLGISEKYISRIENGSGGVKVETLINYMNILGISPNVIFNKLIINESIKPQITLSEKIKNLSPRQIDFISSVIDLIQVLDDTNKSK